MIDPRGDWFPERGLCGAGFAIPNALDVAVEDWDVSDAWSWGRAATGALLAVRDSQFANLQLCNEGGAADCMRALGPGHTGWGQGLATGVRGADVDGPLNSGIVIGGNTIRRSWDGAIDPLAAEHVVIRGNTVVDAWSVGEYLDNARTTVAEANAFIFSNPIFSRPLGGDDDVHAAGCIGIGTERWCTFQPLLGNSRARVLFVTFGRSATSNTFRARRSFSNVIP